MPTGIRATVAFDAADVCPVAELSAEAGTTIDSMRANVCVDGAGGVTEFPVESDRDPGHEDLEPVFSRGSTDLYRLSHDGDATCPCECLGQFGCPVARYVATEGTLTIVFHAAGYDRLREIVAELRERFPGVDIQRFVRSPAAGETDRILVDRGRLTDRQLEVLETAYGMGYFERPRGANATEVAAELDINPSTFTEHVAAAETKLLGELLS